METLPSLKICKYKIKNEIKIVVLIMELKYSDILQYSLIKYRDLSGNNIESLPSSFYNLKKLENL